jgi:hypothetical protein
VRQVRECLALDDQTEIVIFCGILGLQVSKIVLCVTAILLTSAI